jgi:hypothetical protein
MNREVSAERKLCVGPARTLTASTVRRTSGAESRRASAPGVAVGAAKERRDSYAAPARIRCENGDAARLRKGSAPTTAARFPRWRAVLRAATKGPAVRRSASPLKGCSRGRNPVTVLSPASCARAATGCITRGAAIPLPTARRGVKLRDEHVGDEGAGLWLRFSQEDEKGVPVEYEGCSTPEKPCVGVLSLQTALEHLRDFRAGKKTLGFCYEHSRRPAALKEIFESRIRQQLGDGQKNGHSKQGRPDIDTSARIREGGRYGMGIYEEQP